MAEVDLEFLGRQLALLLEGQREIRTQLVDIRGRLAETVTRDLLVRVLRSFEGQVDGVEIRTQLLHEALAVRVKAAGARLDGLEAGT